MFAIQVNTLMITDVDIQDIDREIINQIGKTQINTGFFLKNSFNMLFKAS